MTISSTEKPKKNYSISFLNIFKMKKEEKKLRKNSSQKKRKKLSTFALSLLKKKLNEKKKNPVTYRAFVKYLQ